MHVDQWKPPLQYILEPKKKSNFNTIVSAVSVRLPKTPHVIFFVLCPPSDLIKCETILGGEGADRNSKYSITFPS